MKKHPVIVYWVKSGETVRYDSIKNCAMNLMTSTSQIKRLLESGNEFKRGYDYCTIDDA